MKKYIKRIVTILCIIVITIIVLLSVLFLFQPISHSNKSVGNYVRKHIPIGTSWEDAINTIENNKWEIQQTNSEYGLRINDEANNVSFATEEDMSDLKNVNIRIVGSKAILVELGEYYAPFNTAVFAYLAFDEKGNLIEIAIRRDIDAI